MANTKIIEFSFTVTGALMSMEVYANDKLVKHTLQNGVYKGNFKREYKQNEDVLIDFTMGAPNGTGYKIEYESKTNGVASKDPNNPSPIQGTIIKNNARIEGVKL